MQTRKKGKRDLRNITKQTSLNRFFAWIGGFLWFRRVLAQFVLRGLYSSPIESVELGFVVFFLDLY